MANLNKVMLIGRLTRDVEVVSVGGGKLAKFSIAVNGRKKNKATGEWEDDPVFVDCEAWNRGETGRMADTCEKHLSKGSELYAEGRLRLDRWETRDGERRQKLVVSLDAVQPMRWRVAGDERGGGGASPPTPPSESGPVAPAGGGDSDIPF